VTEKGQQNKKAKSRDLKRIEEELSDLLTAQVEINIKKRVKRYGKMEDMGELVIHFGSTDTLNGLIENLTKTFSKNQNDKENIQA
jgi:ParB family chromosome partitioning protein